MCLMPLFCFFTCWTAIWDGKKGGVRSHFEGKNFTYVLQRYFLHISPQFQRMSTDGTTSKAVLKSQISVNGTVIQASSGLKDTQVISLGNSTKKLYKFKFLIQKIITGNYSCFTWSSLT